MSDERLGLAKAIEAIADGQPVDWADLEARAQGEQDRRRLRQLRIVAAVASLPDSAGERAADEDAAVATAPGTWGHLELLDKVGEGGFGEVYRAREKRLERVVALKLIRPGLAQQALAHRLLDEGKLLARLNHPNVVTVHGADVHDGRVGLWMEFVQGTTLEAMLQASGPFGASEAALIGQEVCRAVAAVHAAGLIHGDIKANNVMREQGGRVVLMDFGAGHAMATAGGDGVRLTGTPFYVAPELLTGGIPSVSSDVYALAVLLYHLVTGDYPIKADSLEELRRAHVEGRGTRLHDARPDLPEAFLRVVDRGLDPDPARRYSSAGGMKTALGASLGMDAAALDLDRLLPEPSPGPAEKKPNGLGRGGRIAVMLLALGVGVLALRPWLSWGPADRGGTVHAEPLAVMPFENLTGDAAWGHVAEGVAEDVARELRRFNVPVRGRQSLTGRQGVQLTDRGELARRLGVRDLVVGSVSLAAGNVEILVKLLEAESGDERWSGRYVDRVDRVAGVSGSVASGVAQALGIRDAPVRGAATGDPASYRAYLAYQTGRVYWKERSEESLQRSIQYYKQAIAFDPGYAQPWAGLADAHIALGVPTFGTYTPQEGRRLATEAALRGLELDPDMVEAQASLAFVAYFYDWNWQAAEDRFRKAIALDSQYAVAHHWYADYLGAMGRHDEAMKEIREALAIEPLSTFIHRDVAWHLFFHGDYDAARAQLQATLAMQPGYGSARTLLGRVLLEQGAYAEGLRELEEVAPTLPQPASLALLAYAYAAAGQRDRAERLRDELVALRPRKYVSPYYVALVETRLGRTEPALDWLERGYREQDTTMVNLLTDPRLEPLRAHPRYRSLLARMRFPASAER